MASILLRYRRVWAAAALLLSGAAPVLAQSAATLAPEFHEARGITIERKRPEVRGTIIERKLHEARGTTIERKLHEARRATMVREGNGIRVDVGSHIGMSCTLRDAEGESVTTLPSGQPLSEARPMLVLVHGPEDGIEGHLGAATADIRLVRNGLFVFRCDAGNAAALGNVETPTRHANVRSEAIGRGEAEIVDPNTGTVLQRIETDQPFEVRFKAFSDTQPEHVIRPSNTDLLIRPGDGSCDRGGGNAAAQFERFTTSDWDAETGISKRFVPRNAGSYTVIVSQLDSQGGNDCQALPFTVDDDLYPPEIERRFPAADTHQLQWDNDLLRVSGLVRDSGSGVASVTVSNGHWSESARLFDGSVDGVKKFYSDLPFARGLQLIEIVAEDRAGHRSRQFDSFYVGARYAPIHTGSDRPTGHYAVNALQLELGRSLIRNNRAGIDSLSEAAADPEILSLLGEGDFLEPIDVDERIDQSFLANVGNAIKPDLEAHGTIVPGRPEISVLPDGGARSSYGDTLGLRVVLPLSGHVTMTCDGVQFGWERALCAAAGAPSGEFDVNIDGPVVARLPIQVSAIGGLTLYALPNDLSVRNGGLSISNGLRNNSTINNGFREKILDGFKQKLSEMLWSLGGCPESANAGERCRPEPPYVVQSDGGDRGGRPNLIGVGLNGRENTLKLDYSLPQVFEDGDVAAQSDVVLERLKVDNGRLKTVLSANLALAGAQKPTGIHGLLIDRGTVQHEDGGPLVPQAPDMTAVFGSGNRDVQGMLHRSLLNEVITQYWATDALDYRANLFDLLDRAEFFAGDQLAEGMVRAFAAAGVAADIVVEMQAPPRLTVYAGASGLFAEIGDVRVVLDLNADFDSRLVFEVALITRIDVSADGDSVHLSFSDPTGCEPNLHRFMACNGRFDLALRSVHGFTIDGPRPDLLDSDEFYTLFLERLGITDDGGVRRDNATIESFYRDALAGALSSVLGNGVDLPLPTIPIPRFNEDLDLPPLHISNLTFDSNLDGGFSADGWLGFTFDLRAEPSD